MSFANKQYTALKSSLPFLKQGENPPMSPERFLYYCSSYLTPEKLSALGSLSFDAREIPPDAPKDSVRAVYGAWEIALRNALASLRSAKNDIDAARYTVRFAEYVTDAAAVAAEVFAAQVNPLEKERMFDRARWRKLDELELWHTVDFDALCIYRLKLLILEKWRVSGAGDPKANFEKAAAEITGETYSDKKKDTTQY